MTGMIATDETTAAMMDAEYTTTTRHVPPREQLSLARLTALLYFSLGASVFIFVLVHFLLAML